MKKITNMGRKVLRKIFLALGATTISMLFAACYGTPMDDYCMTDKDCYCYYCIDTEKEQLDKGAEKAETK